jgi:NAD(P)-dependent dehydrogenase (short-subunit alcohol dehydrogenase family)
MVAPAPGFTGALWTTGDVRSSDDVDWFVQSTREELGHIDVLINCAGAVSRAPVEDITDEDWATVIDVNLTGTFRCTRAALKVMTGQARGGCVVNVASQAGIRVEPMMAHYSASKAAVLQFTKSVALEYAPIVRVNSICPGLIETSMVRESLAGYAKNAGLTYDEAVTARRKEIPMGRFQSAKNLSDGVLFLASSAAGEITGANLDVSGGELIPR